MKTVRVKASVQPRRIKPKAPLLCATAAGEWLPAAELLNAALAGVKQDRDISLDVAGLDSIGADSLQPLLALKASQTGRGRTMTFLHLSPALTGALHCVGAAEMLGIGLGGEDA